VDQPSPAVIFYFPIKRGGKRKGGEEAAHLSPSTLLINRASRSPRQTESAPHTEEKKRRRGGGWSTHLSAESELKHSIDDVRRRHYLHFYLTPWSAKRKKEGRGGRRAFITTSHRGQAFLSPLHDPGVGRGKERKKKERKGEKTTSAALLLPSSPVHRQNLALAFTPKEEDFQTGNHTTPSSNHFKKKGEG